MRRRIEMAGLVQARLKALVLAVACGWLLLVLTMILSPAAAAFSIVGLSAPLVTPTTICVANCSTPTNPPAPTNTPASTATPTGTPGSTPTVVPTATATPPPGGGGDNGGNAPAGPQVTRFVLSQPTIGANGDGPLQGLTPSAFGSNGLLLAGTLSCVVGLLGIIIAAIALLVLIRGGYGPFLKALLRGKRVGRTRGALPASGIASGTGYGPRGQGFNADNSPRRDNARGASSARSAHPQSSSVRNRRSRR